MKTRIEGRTPTPWHLIPGFEKHDYFVRDSDGMIAHLDYGHNDNEANAAFIVQACNAYSQNQETIKTLLAVAIISLEAFKNKRGEKVIASCIYELEKVIVLAEKAQAGK